MTSLPSIRKRFPLLVLLLLGVIFAQTSGSAARTSLTIDEGLHITSGYTMLRTGDFRLVEEHPPLVKELVALPLLLVPGLPDPTTLPGWESDVTVLDSVRLVRAAQALIYPYRPIDRLVFAARLPVALLTVLLGAVVFRWAADLWGRRGGLLALFLLAFDPNVLAHGAVAGTDLGAAFFITLALFALARFLRRPTTPRLLLAGVTLGLAQGAKLSGLLLLPIVLLLGVLALPGRKRLALLLLFLVAGLTLWALYGFEVGAVPGLPFPVPAASHRIPWLRLRQHAAGGHAAFLMGEVRWRGWWYYFPVAFALKTPLPTLLLLSYGLLRLARRGRCKLQLATCNLQLAICNLVLFSALYAFLTLFSPLNIGYRHLLPLLPLLHILIAGLAAGGLLTAHRERWSAKSIPRLALFALLVWYVVGTLRLAPHYLAYFNELAGGPDGGWRYLADSNTDWGQGYKDLARFQRERGLGKVRLSAFIFYDPAIYGVDYEPLTPMGGDTPPLFPSRFNPPPGDYVISATTLDGIPLADPEMYDWFRRREPDARIAHVLFYYHVPAPDPAPTWAAQCTVPVTPLTPEAAAEGFGRSDLRMPAFDCTQSWLYPDGGRSAGWYVLPRERVLEADPFLRQRLASARLSFEQKVPRAIPPFAIFAWSPTTVTPPAGPGDLRAASGEGPTAQVAAQAPPVVAPVPLEGPLTFLGYEVAQEDRVVTLVTYWRVTERPDRPFSLMAHLLGADGRPVAVGDGLGIAWDQLQPGDLLVERHRLSLPPEAPAGPYRLQTGAYWLGTMERWSVLSEGKPVGDRLLLATVEVPPR